MSRARRGKGQQQTFVASVNVDKLSLKELLDLEGKLERAIAAAREREHGELKQDLAAFAEKRGFLLKELQSSLAVIARVGPTTKRPKYQTRAWQRL